MPTPVRLAQHEYEYINKQTDLHEMSEKHWMRFQRVTGRIKMALGDAMKQHAELRMHDGPTHAKLYSVKLWTLVSRLNSALVGK